MGFWSGFESLTGHQPGAFKGFTLKDILDEDMWKMVDRKFPSPRYAEEGLPTPQTAWYKGMGRPEMMGPRVGGAGVPVNPAAVTPTYRGPQTPGVARTTAAPWANIQSQMLEDPRLYRPAASADRDVGMGANRFLQLGDPRNIRAGPDLPPASGFRSQAVGMLRRDPTPKVLPPTPPGTTDEFIGGRWVPTADKTTVVKKFADPNISDTQTTTIKEKLNQASTWQPEPGAKARPMWGLADWFKDFQKSRDPGFYMKGPWGDKNLDPGFYIEGPWKGKNLDPGFSIPPAGAWDAIKAQLDEERRRRGY